MKSWPGILLLRSVIAVIAVIACIALVAVIAVVAGVALIVVITVIVVIALIALMAERRVMGEICETCEEWASELDYEIRPKERCYNCKLGMRCDRYKKALEEIITRAEQALKEIEG